MKVLKEFDDSVSHISQKALIADARLILMEKLDAAWDQVVLCNEKFGNQVKGDILTEIREVLQESNMGPIGGNGLLRSVNVTMQKMRVESRAKVHRRRGGPPEIGPWIDTHSTTTRILESAFESFSTLPIFRGRLQKTSPNVLRQVFTVFSAGSQERACLLKDGHFLWWEPDKMAESEAAGCINFFIHRATVSTNPNFKGFFCIKPAEPQGWASGTSFSGGAQREFWFDASECEVTSKEWVEGIQRHIQFAKLVREQLGEEKVMAEVGIYKPTLTQADG